MKLNNAKPFNRNLLPSITANSRAMTIQRARNDLSIFSHASRYSNPKYKQVFSDELLQSEMDLLKSLMHLTKKPSLNIRITPFQQFERLKCENQAVISRKSLYNSKNDLTDDNMDNYVYQIKKFPLMRSKLRNKSVETFAADIKLTSSDNTSFYKPLPAQSRLMVKGMKIRLRKPSSIEEFLNSRLPLNLFQMNSDKLKFSRENKDCGSQTIDFNV